MPSLPFSQPPSQQTYSSTSRTSSKPWESERQRRLAKGLCFCCNERYSPGHRCKPASLTLMELEDSENPTKEVAGEAEIENPEAEITEVTFHAILGSFTCTTMKLKGSLGQTEVIILMDSGSTHNFISTQLVEDI